MQNAEVQMDFCILHCAFRLAMIVTIDGPAGAGKSSAAQALARRLGFDYLDTGAMYRAVTLAVARAGIDPGDEDAVLALLARLSLEMPPGQVLLDGKDVSGLIRSAEVTRLSGKVADSPVVRRWLGGLQRQIAAGRNIVCEGRDQGTVIFPDAGCKFFLLADPTERARRRQAQMASKGEQASLQDVLEAQQARDGRDQARDQAPMVAADDAILLDSTNLTLEEVVSRMEQEVGRCDKR